MVEFSRIPIAKLLLISPSLASLTLKHSTSLPLACIPLFLVCLGLNLSTQSLIGVTKPFFHISSTICPHRHHLRHPNRRTSRNHYTKRHPPCHHYVRPLSLSQNASPTVIVPRLGNLVPHTSMSRNLRNCPHGSSHASH